MQFNLVNDQEQLAYSLSGVALHGVSVRVYQYFFFFFGGGRVPAAFLARIISMWRFSWHLRAVLAVSGSFAYYACTCVCPRGFAWLSIRCVGAPVLSSISPPSSPYSGE